MLRIRVETMPSTARDGRVNDVKGRQMKPAQILPAAFAVIMATLPATAEDVAPMIAQSCAGCHGQAGAGQGSVPDLRGYDRAAFIRIWDEFRTGARPAAIMNRIAPGFTDADVAALADYFSSLE